MQSSSQVLGPITGLKLDSAKVERCLRVQHVESGHSLKVQVLGGCQFEGAAEQVYAFAEVVLGVHFHFFYLVHCVIAQLPPLSIAMLCVFNQLSDLLLRIQTF